MRIEMFYFAVNKIKLQKICRRILFGTYKKPGKKLILKNEFYIENSS